MDKVNDSLNPITAPERDKRKDRERIESLYLTRQVTKEEFSHFLKEGDHYVR